MCIRVRVINSIMYQITGNHIYILLNNPLGLTCVDQPWSLCPFSSICEEYGSFLIYLSHYST